jgi:hypothetical protein
MVILKPARIEKNFTMYTVISAEVTELIKFLSCLRIPEVSAAAESLTIV